MSTTAPPIQIRAAAAADAPQLAALRYRFRAELAAPAEAEAQFITRASVWLESRLAQGTWRAWVAVDDGDQIVGHVFAHRIEKIPNPVIEAEQIVYLTNVYVVPTLRNHGIGGRLLQTALTACDTDEVDTIILWPSARSRPLYLRYGFAPPRSLLERPADAESA